MIAKWFNAPFHPPIGIVHFLDAAWIALDTNGNADSPLGYGFRFRTLRAHPHRNANQAVT